jgi:tetratricopeptide (TPR) repeat protein
MESLCSTLLAIGEINRGSPGAAVAAARHALSIGQEIDNEWAQTNAMVLLGYGLWDTGEYGEALRVTRRGLELARKVQHPGAMFILTVLDSTLQAMFDLEGGHAGLLEALTVAAALPRPWKTTALSRLCANRAHAGDWGAAHRYALEAATIRDAAPSRLIGFDFERYPETKALLRGGDEELAREDARRLGESAGQNRRFRLVYLRMLAVLDRWDSDTEGAMEHLREAGVLAEEMGLPGELWQIRAALGELHEEQGEHEEARGAFHRTAEVIEALAGKIENEELREDFLSAPQVRRLLVPEQRGLRAYRLTGLPRSGGT